MYLCNMILSLYDIIILYYDDKNIFACFVLFDFLGWKLSDGHPVCRLVSSKTQGEHRQ